MREPNVSVFPIFLPVCPSPCSPSLPQGAEDGIQNQAADNGAGYCRVRSLCVKPSCEPPASFLHEEPVFLAHPHSSLCSLALNYDACSSTQNSQSQTSERGVGGSSHAPSELKAFPLVQL